MMASHRQRHGDDSGLEACRRTAVVRELPEGSGGGQKGVTMSNGVGNRRGKGTRAWVIRWSWMGDHARVENPIVAILPWRWGVARLKPIVEAIHDVNADRKPEHLLTQSR